MKDKQIDGSVMGLHFKGRGKVKGTQYSTCNHHGFQVLENSWSFYKVRSGYS